MRNYKGAALGDCAGCRSLKGMTEIAKSAGTTREAVHKALRTGQRSWIRLGFDTVSRVCAALGVKLVVEVV